MRHLLPRFSILGNVAKSTSGFLGLHARMDLRAEIDRGEVVLARPKLDKEGHKKWKSPVSDRPTLTLYARVGKGEVALGRWPTTIGGWRFPNGS
jgi:hypothetical protein